MRRKNYLWYRFWRHTVVGNGLKFFYKDIKAVGKENLPKDKPILYIPNHQNSFMDALHVAVTTKPVIYFLTRAQAFKPSIVGKFLWSINMMPVYRIRDGFSSIQKNNEIFEKCIRYLKNKDTILIFAEANHNLKRRIRPLSKGFTRIAFGAEEKHDWDLDLQIVPVGINYTRHRKAGNTVQVNYGKPIPVKNYRDTFIEDERKGVESMKRDVSDAMKNLVFHVDHLNEYPVYKILWDDLEPDDHKTIDPDVANSRIAKTETYLTEDLVEKAKSLNKKAEKAGFELQDLAASKTFGLKQFLLSPLYLFSFINNLIPYQPVRYMVANMIKDQAFDASIKFLLSLVTFPAFYITVSVILGLLNVEWEIIAGYLLISLITAPMFVRAKDLFSRSPKKKLQKDDPKLFSEIEEGLNEFSRLRTTILNE
jgi:1-acyl-sn-glycerol-3-phosphate acyltransferase